MGLVPCPACKREVSTEAVSCPGCGHPLAQPAERKKRLIGVWRTTRITPGPLDVVHATVTIEFQEGGTCTWVNESDDTVGGTQTFSGSARYAYSNGVLTLTGSLDWLGKVSVTWVGDNEFSMRHSDGTVWRWTRVG
jgi:hypothetical protein